MSPKWFVSWFDSEYYHLLYDNRDEAEAEKFMRNLVDFLRVPNGAKILDAACGRGRHARLLSEMGFEVDGIDLSQNSIAFASEYSTPKLNFYVHDIREVFRAEYYDLVFNLFTSFGYFEEDEIDFQVFDNLCANLKPGGKLVIDYLNTPLVRATVDTTPQEVVKNSVIFKTQKELQDGAVLKHIEFYDRDTAEEGSFTERVKLLEVSDFKNFAKASGREIIQVFGDYDLGVYDAAKSPRLIMVFG